MISRKEYVRAKYIILEYERQQKYADDIIGTDVKLIEVLSTRAQNIIHVHNSECEAGSCYSIYKPYSLRYTNDDKIVYASDVAKFIIKCGEYNYFRRFRNSGKKTVDEIMKYAEPFLDKLAIPNFNR